MLRITWPNEDIRVAIAQKKCEFRAADGQSKKAITAVSDKSKGHVKIKNVFISEQ